MNKRICAVGPVTKIIDIYHGDYISDLGQVIKAGYAGAYLKCWENSEDSSFASRWKAIYGKMYRGAYDFFHPEHDAIAQAEAFVAAMGPLEDDDMPPMLDWESSGGVGSQGDREAGYQWLLTVQKLTGRRPIIYGSAGFLAPLALDRRFLSFDLYIANYGASCPMIPAPWSAGPGWKLWQTNGKGSVPGMRGPVDTDLFNGDLNALKAWIKSTKLA